MKLRHLSTGGAVALGAFILIGLIAVITFIAWRVISRTVSEQFQSTELQLVTSLAQQTQSQLGNLEANIIRLAAQEDIRATSPTRFGAAREQFALQAQAYPPGTITSITRFDFRGRPRYAYPENLNESIRDLESADDYPYQVPEELVALTRRGQRVTGQIETGFYRPLNSLSPNSVLLITPVDSVTLDTEFLVYEINLQPLFAELFSFVDLGETGQLWVLDNRGNVQYAARPEPAFDSTYQAFSYIALLAIREPVIRAYDDAGLARQAAIVSLEALDPQDRYVIFLTRSASEAQQGVTQNVQGIFGFSVAAMLVVMGLGVGVANQVVQANEARRSEEQRRQTARILLEISRALNSTLDFSSVLERILAELQTLVPHDSASILMLDEDDLRLSAIRGLEGDIGKVLKREEARAASQVLDKGEPILINDVSQDPRWTQGPDRTPIGAWIGLPLRVRDKLVGVLNINSTQANRFTQEDMDLALAFADQASVALLNARNRDIETKAVEQELNIARGIQTSLLPDSPPSLAGLEFAAYSSPASQVGGDYYQFLPLPNGKIAMAIGDVQGKGVPAALMMAVISTAIRDEIAKHPKPAELLHALNKRLLERMRRNHINSALTVAVIDPIQQQLDVSNAGMVQPYVRQPDQNTFEFVAIGGYPLGISERMRYSTKTTPFQTGSLMVMFSDGILEAQNAKGEFFGFDRVEALLNSLPKEASAQDICDRLMAAVREHLGELSQQDDITLIVVKALDLPLPVEAPVPDSGVVMMPKALPFVAPKLAALVLPSELGLEKAARAVGGELAEAWGYSGEQVENIKTALAEATMNAIEHGNGQDANLPVRVMFTATADSLRMQVMDAGKKSLPKTLPEPGKGDMRGWGLFLISSLMDEFEIEHLPEGGNLVQMAVKKAPVPLNSDLAKNGNEKQAEK